MNNETIAACLKFPKDHLKVTQGFWKCPVDRWDKTWTFWQKCTMLYLEEKKSLQTNTETTSSCEAWGRSTTVWNCFTVSGPGQITVTEWTMKKLYRDILQQKGNLNRSWMIPLSIWSIRVQKSTIVIICSGRLCLYFSVTRRKIRTYLMNN